ncbi:MAG: pyridoxal-phosphate dependent enzyme, partial [Sulfurimonadaceae bacterium]|nr:pyridoxal-phosphate dependent enzyme [Sulfurimonadaceae bacterium]
MPAPLSAVETISVRGRTFSVKRDDTLHPLFSGNKYRKLHTLLNTPSDHYDKVISYGGTQSNAMLSIAALAHEKGWQFDYYSKPVAKHLKESPTGNLKAALELEMNLIEISHESYDETIENVRNSNESGSFFIPQGGADPSAGTGVKLAADEIRQWQHENGIEELTVVTPSGTGTTAYYLAASLQEATI